MVVIKLLIISQSHSPWSPLLYIAMSVSGIVPFTKSVPCDAVCTVISFRVDAIELG